MGGGHAGCEAAMAAANLGQKVLLLSIDTLAYAKMSCNPAVGGIAKGQIVKEIDALGGYTGIVTDACSLQFRMLNKSKGPAMWSPRAQCDKVRFSAKWREFLVSNCNLTLYEDICDFLLVENRKICGIRTLGGRIFKSQAVILTAGTFLSGKLFIGQRSFEGGRIGECASYGLTEQLVTLGVRTARMKTGTPPRIDITTVDTSKLTLQYGDSEPDRFSYLDSESSVQRNPSAQLPCYILHTNPEVHSTLRAAFDQSPLFTGLIKGRGPRYCPSIEDKLRVFPDKDEHQLFLEPEGMAANEYYLQGFSSSLPFEVQIAAMRKIEGMENAQVYRPAYAVEYDFFDPTQLKPTLEMKSLDGLFMAGQVNGTTGYEEAAAQGLMAGINAALKNRGEGEFVLARDEAYIGVLIDDLITKGVDEPYRMFTSRAEFRLLLRQDNADRRLTEKSYKIGLASKERNEITKRKYQCVDSLISLAESIKLKPENVNEYLLSIGSAEISESKSIADLVARPAVELKRLLDFVPRGTFARFGLKQEDLELGNFDCINQISQQSSYSKKDSGISSGMVSADLPDSQNSAFSSSKILESAEIELKYKGYIEREKQAAEKLHRLESLTIPENYDFSRIQGLTIECRQKLAKYNPRTIAQASRISGVSPADISVLLVYFGR